MKERSSKIKRIFATLLACLLLLASLPITAIAQAVGEVAETAEDGQAGADQEQGSSTSSSSITNVERPNLIYVGWDNDKGYSKEIKGTGTEDDPYKIETPEALQKFAESVNSGEAYEGDYIELVNNIDYGGKAWTPVGSLATPFEGNFDGKSHEVANYIIVHRDGVYDLIDQYVGFFGYVENAKITDFGVYDYLIGEYNSEGELEPYSYNYDTVMGALVASAVNTEIIGCYASGDIYASFQNVNPIDRPDAKNIVPTTVSEIPTSISYANENGQGVILDLTKIGSATVNKTITISGDVSALKIKGNGGTFTNLKISISSKSTLFYLELENVILKNTTGIGITVGSQDLYIAASGASEVYGGADSLAVKTGGMLYIFGEGQLSLVGGNGSNGGNGVSSTKSGTAGTAGTNGATGSYAVEAQEIHINTINEGSVAIVGGNGGNGGDGGNGYAGVNKTGTCAGEWRTHGSCKGATGGDGSAGGAGGNGGAGGAPINARLIAHGSSLVYLVSGNGGNGGDGGNGGNGGSGQAGANGWVAAGYEPGHAGGNGGNGGNGGKGGNGGGSNAIATSIAALADANVTVVTLESGNGGNGGDGGNGGSGGRGGKSCNNWFYGHGAREGAGGNGGDGGCAGAGGDGYTVGIGGNGGARGSKGYRGYCQNGGCSSVSNGTNGVTRGIGSNGYYSSTYSIDQYAGNGAYDSFTGVIPFRAASIEVGGFIGTADLNTIIKQSAALVNDICTTDSAIKKISETNTVSAAVFGASVECTPIEIVASYEQEKDIYIRYAYDKFLENKKYEDTSNIYVLQNRLDDSGVFYSWGYDEEKVTNTVSVLPIPEYVKSITEEHINIPEFVYNGRGVAKVTEISDKAFAEQNHISEITVGDNVERIGQEAFLNCLKLNKIFLGNGTTYVGKKILAGCSSLETIKIGKSLNHLQENYDIEEACANGLFGVDKTSPNFKKYEVEGNKTFAAIDGILYERFNGVMVSDNPDLAGPVEEEFSVPVAIIDVPSGAELPLDENGYSVFDPTSNEELAYLVKIYPSAFAYNRTINIVKLDQIRDIGANAFNNASALREVYFNDFVPKTETVKILDKVYAAKPTFFTYSIGTQAFAGCSQLRYVNLDSAFIETIGNAAFANSGSQSSPLRIVLGLNVKSINGCNGTSVEGKPVYNHEYAAAFENSNVAYYDVVATNGKTNDRFFAHNGVLYVKTGSYVEGKYVVDTTEDGREKLLLAAYPSCGESNSFEIPTIEGKEIFAVASKAFMNAFSNSTATGKISIGGMVQYIGDLCFANAKAHTIELGKNVVQLGAMDSSLVGMFNSDVAILNQIKVEEGNTSYDDIDGVLYKVDEEGKLSTLIKYPANKLDSEFEVHPDAKVILSEAFKNNKSLRYVFFQTREGEKVQSIGERAFMGCSSLEIVLFNKGDYPDSVGAGAFSINKNEEDQTQNLVIVGYGEATDKWKYEESLGVHKDGVVDVYVVQNFENYVSLDDMKEIAGDEDKKQSYYAVVVVDKNGEYLHDIAVSLTMGKINSLTGEPEYPSIMVDSQTGQITKPEGAYYESIATRIGMSMFYVPDYDAPYLLEVMDNTGTYYPFKNTELYLDEETRTTYIVLSSVPTVSNVSVSYQIQDKSDIQLGTSDTGSDGVGTNVFGQDLFFGYAEGEYQVVDTNTDVAKINQWTINDIILKFRVGYDTRSGGSNVSIVNYSLVQDNEIKAFVTNSSSNQNVKVSAIGSGKSVAEIAMNVNADIFEPSTDIYFIVEMSTGEILQTKVNIDVFFMDFVGVNLPVPDENGITFSMADNIPFIGGKEISIPADKFPVTTAVGDDYIRVLFGEILSDKDFKDQPELTKAQKREKKLNEIMDEWDEYVDNVKTGSDGFQEWCDSDFGFKITGYLERHYKGNGEYEMITHLEGLVTYKVEFGTSFTVVVVPVRVEIEVSLEGKLVFELVFNENAKIFETPELTLSVKGTIELRAGVGLKCASLGIYGEASILLVLDISPVFQLEQVTLSADIGFYIKVDLWFIKFNKKFSIWNGTWDVYKREEPSVAALNYAALFDESNYEIAAANPAMLALRRDDGTIEAESTDYTAKDHKLYTVGDTTYIVYTEQIKGGDYDSYNCTKLVYQTYKNGELSEVKLLDDNGLNDGEFALVENNGTLTVAYTQLNRKITQDEAERSSQQDASAIADCLGSFEVKTATWDEATQSFVTSEEALTSNSSYDMYLNLAVVNGETTLVWVQNDANTMFGTTTDSETSSIMMSTLGDDGKFSTPTALKTNVNTITDIELGDDSVAYITDTDNLFSRIKEENGKIVYDDEGNAVTEPSADDRVINMIKLPENGESGFIGAVSEEGEHLDVSYADNTFWYYKGGNLYELDGHTNVLTSVSTLPDEYKIINDSLGNVRAVLYISQTTDPESGVEISSLYAIFPNNGDELPVLLRSFTDGTTITQFDAVDNGDSMLAAMTVSSILENEDPSSDELIKKDEFLLEEIEYPSEIVIDDITFEPDSVVPYKSSTFTVFATNNGSTALDKLNLSASFGNGSLEIVSVSDFYDESGDPLSQGLSSGRSGYADVVVKMAGIDVDEQLTLTVENGESKSIDVWYSNLAVYGKAILIGEEYYIIARVTNKGYVESDGSLSADIVDSYLVQDENGNVIEKSNNVNVYSQSVANLGHNDSTTIKFKVDKEAVTDDECMLHLSVLGAENEMITSNNVSRISLATAEVVEVNKDDLSALATIDRVKRLDTIVTLDDGYELEGIRIDDVLYDTESGLYAVDGQKLIITAEVALSILENGTYTLIMILSDENGNQIESSLILKITEQYSVIWDVEGTTKLEDYEKGEIPDYSGSLHKAPTKQYTYTFVGWDTNGDGIADEITEIEKDMKYTAIFKITVNSYSVTWNVEGEIFEQEVEYGNIPTFDGLLIKEGTPEYSYAFIGWDTNGDGRVDEVNPVTDDIEYTAIFKSVTNTYEVVWLIDGEEYIQYVEYGQMPSYNSAVVKDSTVQYDYTFVGWDANGDGAANKVSVVTGNASYTAIFESTVRCYKIGWCIDGRTIYQNYEYGEMPIYDGTPMKVSDDKYSYEFIGWDSEISVVTGEKVYTALFDSILKQYMVTWVVDGKVYTQSYNYGQMPVFEESVDKAEDEYRYTFVGWDSNGDNEVDEVVTVSGMAVYSAVYEKQLIPTATVSNTEFDAAWGTNFTTTVFIEESQGLTSYEVVIYYNTNSVTIENIELLEDVTAIEQGDTYIKLYVENVGEGQKNLADLTFKVKENAPFGEIQIMAVTSDSDIKITDKLMDMHIYQKGDVNMDGKINTIDAAMIQRYAVKKCELTEIQLAYANVNSDYTKTGAHKVNTIDAALVQRLAAKRIDEIGERISLVFVQEEDGISYEIKYSMEKGGELESEPFAEEGFVWSLSNTEYVEVDYSKLTDDTVIYLIQKQQ